MYGTLPLIRFLPVLALTLAGAAGAESGPAEILDAAATPAATEPPAAPGTKASPRMPAKPEQAQIAAWLAAARALKAERPELFSGAEGVLATLVLPEDQGAAVGIKPGDVLIAYGDIPLDSAKQLIGLTSETPPKESLTLHWLRAGVEKDAQVHQAEIHGGRIGVRNRNLVESPESRMQGLLDSGRSASERSRYAQAIGLFERG